MNVSATTFSAETAEIVISFGAKRQQMPSETSDERARQGVKRADKHAVIQGALPAMMQSRTNRKSLGHNPNLAEPGQQRSEFGNAECPQCRGILVLEADFHQLRQ